jgi:pimeloyl-ACP methyl ester carboxylesterase
MKRKHQIILATVVVAGLLGYRLWQGETRTTQTHSASSGAYRIAAHAQSFRFGDLEFTRCEIERKHSAATTAAYCAPFQVPENRDQPDSRTLDLRLALIPSSQAADDDFIVFLAGGPGQSAVDTWPQMAAALDAAGKHRHVLLLDQRGTGKSNPLECKALADQGSAMEFDLGRVRDATRACLGEVSERADPRFYTSSDAVADLEQLRQALGAPRFDLVGISYGTRMAQQYAKRHPEGVRSIVLDSVAPNDLVLGSEFARNLDDALKAQFAYCAMQPACTKAFPDPYADILKLRDELTATPRTLSVADPVSFQRSDQRLDAFGLAALVRMYAYSPETASLIPLVVAESLRGNDAPLLGQIDLLTGNMEDLIGNAMQLSVICAEDADLLAPDPAAQNMLLGNQMVEAIQEQCAIWPHAQRPADFRTPLGGDIPTLVLEGELDPVTPPRYGEAVIKHLGNAKLIVAKGQGHNVIGRGCLPKLVAGFMDALNPTTLDATCVDALGPVPHFIDFNGAAP